MRLSDQFRGLHRTLLTHRARALLTLLGMMIGTGTIVLLASLLRGGREALMRSNQQASESDLVEVKRDEPPTSELRKTRRDLSEIDAEVLRDSPLLGGARVVSHGWKDVRAYFHHTNKDVSINATTPTGLSLYRLGLQRGRFLNEDDLAERRRVCVVGYEVWQELLESADDLANVRIQIKGEQWGVVGALKDKPMIGNTSGTWIWNRRVLVPQTTFDALYNPAHTATRLFVRLSGSESLIERIGAVKKLVSSTLLRRHYGVHNFSLANDSQQRQQSELILSIIQLLLLGTGLLSLFVGGINIMNIMLVTVTERTREIGIRRAIGAPPRAIMVQFLLESGFIALLGGVLGIFGGIVCAAASTFALSKVVGEWNLHIEPWSIALGLGLSLVTGVIFGLFPAWRAARLDPVEALRYE